MILCCYPFLFSGVWPGSVKFRSCSRVAAVEATETDSRRRRCMMFVGYFIFLFFFYSPLPLHDQSGTNGRSCPQSRLNISTLPAARDFSHLFTRTVVTTSTQSDATNFCVLLSFSRLTVAGPEECFPLRSTDPSVTGDTWLLN